MGECMKKAELDFSKKTSEEFFRLAVIKAAEQEIVELEAMDFEVPEPPEEHRRKNEELLHSK